jgi:hypothetical protein
VAILADFVRWLILPKFFKAGFTSERSGELEGWLSRDGYTDDWILWSPETKQMYRRKDEQDARWRPSPETEAQCLKLGRVYAEMMRLR